MWHHGCSLLVTLPRHSDNDDNVTSKKKVPTCFQMPASRRSWNSPQGGANSSIWYCFLYHVDTKNTHQKTSQWFSSMHSIINTLASFLLGAWMHSREWGRKSCTGELLSQCKVSGIWEEASQVTQQQCKESDCQWECGFQSRSRMIPWRKKCQSQSVFCWKSMDREYPIGLQSMRCQCWIWLVTEHNTASKIKECVYISDLVLYSGSVLWAIVSSPSHTLKP